jgi:hypothetical protein
MKENHVNRSHVNTTATGAEQAAVEADAGAEEEDLDGCVVDLSYQSCGRGGAEPESPGREEDGDGNGNDGEDAFCSPVRGSAGNGEDSETDNDPKTPSLEAWKLSHATRTILDQQKYISRGDGKSPGDGLLAKIDHGKTKGVRTTKNYSNAQVVTRAQPATPPSPGHLDMSVSYVRRPKRGEENACAATLACEGEGDTPVASSASFDDSMDQAMEEEDEEHTANGALAPASPAASEQGVCHRDHILSTPVDEAREILRAHAQLEYSALSASPGTPTFGGTPVTCQVLSNAGGERRDRDLSRSRTGTSSSGAALDEDDESAYQSCNNSCSSIGGAGAGAAVDTSIANSDDGLLDPSSLSKAFASPPTAVRVLNPSRGEKAIVADAENGWIPQVSEEEWKTAPSFLKMQFGISDINETLTLLNKFIAENLTKTESGFSKRLETFSFDEIVRIVGNSIGSAPIKVVVLGLVHFKKLDVGTENSVKVYKIRRFY